MIRATLLAIALGSVGAADAAPLRDPFLRPAAARVPVPGEVPQAAPRLRAVVLNAGRSLANIDGNIVAVGEQFSGYTVQRIDTRGVLIARAGRAQLLTMQDKDFE